MAGFDTEVLNQAHFNRYATLLGIEYDELEEGRCHAHIDVRDDLFHPGGIVHGGVAFSLADSAMALAIISTLETGQNCSTIEMKISYMAAVTEGTMECDASIIRRGRHIIFAEANVTQGDKLVAAATGTFAVVGGD